MKRNRATPDNKENNMFAFDLSILMRNYSFSFLFFILAYHNKYSIVLLLNWILLNRSRYHFTNRGLIKPIKETHYLLFNNRLFKGESIKINLFKNTITPKKLF